MLSLNVEKLQRGQDIMVQGETALTFVIVYEGQAQLTYSVDLQQSQAKGRLKPIKVLINQKQDMSLGNPAMILQSNKLQRGLNLIQNADLKDSVQVKTFPVMTASKHSFIGLECLFNESTQKLGAKVLSESIILVRFTIKNRIKRIWSKLFRSKQCSDLQKLLRTKNDNAIEMCLSSLNSQSLKLAKTMPRRLISSNSAQELPQAKQT